MRWRPSVSTCLSRGWSARSTVAWSVVVLFLVALVALPGAAAHPAPNAPHAQTLLSGAIGYLDTHVSAGGLVPLVVEAHAAAGHHDPRPQGLAAAVDLLDPDTSRPLAGWVRSAHALALAQPGRASHLVDALTASFDEGRFGDPTLLLEDAFAVRTLGALAAQPELQRRAAAWLWDQSVDGTWSWSVGGTPDVDSTGMVWSAIHTHVAESGAQGRHAFLASAFDGGGYAAQPGGDANCNSTVWGIRLLWLDGHAVPPATWDFLIGLRQDDGGFAYQPGQASNPMCTAEVAALLGEGLAGDAELLHSFPEAPPARASVLGLVPAALGLAAAAWSRRAR